MTENKINLAEKTIDELKALAYDFNKVVQSYSQMLQVVEKEIANRQAPIPSSPKQEA